jgi:hypothetical protein
MTFGRVGLDEVGFDFDIGGSDMISDIVKTLVLRCGSRIRARDVGCTKYPRNVSSFHMKFFGFSYEIFLVEILDDG